MYIVSVNVPSQIKAALFSCFFMLCNLSQQSCQCCHTSRNSLETALLSGQTAFCNVLAISIFTKSRKSACNCQLLAHHPHRLETVRAAISPYTSPQRTVSNSCLPAAGAFAAT